MKRTRSSVEGSSIDATRPQRSWSRKRDGLGRHGAGVAGDGDAAALIVQTRQRLVELVEGGLLAEQQVNVVDQQQVELAIAGAEGGAGLVADRGGEFVEELLGADQEEARAVGRCLMGDGVQQVRLAVTAGAGDEQRRVGAVLLGGDVARAGERELVEVGAER